MGAACVGASRKSFQTFRKLEREDTNATRTEGASKVSLNSQRFTRILEKSVTCKNVSRDSPIKLAFPKGTEESKSIIVESAQKKKDKGKENNPNTLTDFMKQKPQSPIQEEVERSRVSNIHPRIAKRYFDQPQP